MSKFFVLVVQFTGRLQLVFLRQNIWSPRFWLAVCLWYFSKIEGWIWVWSWQLIKSHCKTWNKLWELQGIKQYIWAHKNDFRKRQSSFSQKWRLPESEMADWKFVSSCRNHFRYVQVRSSSLTKAHLNRLAISMLVTGIEDDMRWWLRCYHGLNSVTNIQFKVVNITLLPRSM